MLEGETGFYGLDARAKDTTPKKIMTASTGDSILSYSGEESILTINSSDSGLAVSLVGQKDGIKSSIATFNHHWREIRDPECKIIEYEDASGRHLRGEICFPLDYKVGQDRPTIVVVYPGWAPSLTSGDDSSKKVAWFWNLARFTSAGFLVFRPEIPRDPGARTLQDNIVEAVLAGMKKFAADGYGKVGRFGIYGHSYGSIAALTLLSRTKLFDAGVGGNCGHSGSPCLPVNHANSAPMASFAFCLQSSTRA
jgi:dipeptidyl aminopeptidase/acylaminoacyl peptidase